MTNDVNFETWLEQWGDEIIQIQAHAKTDLPKDPHLIQADLNNTTRYYPLAAEMLADVEKHLIDCRAQETLHVKGDPKYDGFSAPERKVIVESRISHIARTRDILQTTCRALQERSYALLNQRRYAEAELRMSGRAE